MSDDYVNRKNAQTTSISASEMQFIVDRVKECIPGEHFCGLLTLYSIIKCNHL